MTEGLGDFAHPLRSDFQSAFPACAKVLGEEGGSAGCVRSGEAAPGNAIRLDGGDKTQRLLRCPANPGHASGLKSACVFAALFQEGRRRTSEGAGKCGRRVCRVAE